MHGNYLHGWTGVLLGVGTLGAATFEQLAQNNEQTLLIVGGEVVVACITGYCLVKVAQLKQHINSRMDELLDLTRASSRAEGVIEGRAQQKKEHEVKIGH